MPSAGPTQQPTDQPVPFPVPVPVPLPVPVPVPAPIPVPLPVPLPVPVPAPAAEPEPIPQPVPVPAPVPDPVPIPVSLPVPVPVPVPFPVPASLPVSAPLPVPGPVPVPVSVPVTVPVPVVVPVPVPVPVLGPVPVPSPMPVAVPVLVPVLVPVPVPMEQPTTSPAPTILLSVDIGIRLLTTPARRYLAGQERQLALDLLSGDVIAAFETASTSFFQSKSTADAFFDVTATALTNQFIDGGGELSTVSQITALSTGPTFFLQSELIALVNGDPDSFIEQLQQNNPEAFADVIDVEAFIPGGLLISPISTSTDSPAPTGAPQIAIEAAPTSLPTTALERLTSVSGSVQIDLFAMADLLSEGGVDLYETATTEFYQNFLPDIYTDINATLRSQFLEAQELMTSVEVIAMTSDPSVEFEQQLSDLVNENEDAFIDLLGTDPPFDEVVCVNPLLTPVTGNIQIKLSAMADLLSQDGILAFELATTEFYRLFLPGIFSGVEALLIAQFFEAQELTAIVQVNGNACNPVTDLQQLLQDLINENADAFIDQLNAFDPVSFADVVRVNADDPVLTPVTGDVLIELFSVVGLLVGDALNAYESGTGAFYQDFLPSIFTDIEATLLDQFSEAQELTTLVQVNGTALIPTAELQPLLVDLINNNKEDFIDQLKSFDPVTFADLVRVNALEAPTTGAVDDSSAKSSNDSNNDTLVWALSTVGAVIAIAMVFLCYYFDVGRCLFQSNNHQNTGSEQNVESEPAVGNNGSKEVVAVAVPLLPSDSFDSSTEHTL